MSGHLKADIVDIENQLEMAESRCDNLKDQLDDMRQINGMSGKLSKVSRIQENSNLLDNSTVTVQENRSRQKSDQIRTDRSGAAVKTINNILNGITISVNRLTEIHSQLGNPGRKVTTANKPALSPKLKSDFKAKNNQKKKRSISQHAVLKKSGRFSQEIDKLGNKNHSKDLVEIYHNGAIKHSDSDESNLKKSKELVPPLNIQQHQHSEQTEMFTMKSDQQLLHAPRTAVSCCYNKNYELPTVASRMKQVAKNYLGTLNVKTIPFCAAISTTQSHNIGINIQQMMNIMKNRQPINGISPTLAHNIGLAAEKLNSKPFSILVSSINSRITQTVSKCPLSRTYLNFQQLQEQAKSIPEDTIQEADEEPSENVSPEMQTKFITGPSGDIEVKTKTTTTWTEKPLELDLCTCIPQNNTLRHLESRFKKNIRTTSDNNLNSQIIENHLKKKLRKSTKEIVGKISQIQTNNILKQKEESTINNREKNLSDVLKNLHHNFENLNRRYEELSLKTQNEDSVKELEKLETELNKKEEEITMVMTLYKEVLALKQQVRQLKDKHSQSSLKDQKIKFKEYNDPEAAFHLTKLLKQIQHYQMCYKLNLSHE